MQPIDLDEDGMLTVRVKGGEVTLDLYDAHDFFVNLNHRFPDRYTTGDTTGYYAAAKEHLGRLGLPSLTSKQVAELRERLFAAIGEQRGKDLPPSNSGTPGSAGFTGGGSAG